MCLQNVQVLVAAGHTGDLYRQLELAQPRHGVVEVTGGEVWTRLLSIAVSHLPPHVSLWRWCLVDSWVATWRVHWTKVSLSDVLRGSAVVWAPQLTISETVLVCMQLFVVGLGETVGDGWVPL